MSPNDGTEWRLRTQTEAEHFLDVSSMSSDVIARLINEHKIQILVNLNGYTKVLLPVRIVDMSNNYLMKISEAAEVHVSRE